MHFELRSSGLASGLRGPRRGRHCVVRSSPFARGSELLFSLFGALAQYERALTRERIMAGLAAAKRRGRQGGRPPTIAAEKMQLIVADRKSTRLNSSH